MSYISNLHRILSEKHFAVTAEIGPPKGSDENIIIHKGEILKGHADAYNITDNQTAVVRMSSIAGSTLLLKIGMEPILQMTCRDRNRIALQSDILGASAVGIRNILLLTGDHQSMGNHPQAMGVYDIDSIQLIQIARNMHDKGIFQNGEEILRGKPEIFIGAAANPFATPLEARIIRLEKKIEAGVDFIQTQSVFNLNRFQEWIDTIRSIGLDKKVYILASVTPLKSIKMMQRMRFHVPGVDIPEEIAERIEYARDPKEEGYNIAVEILEELKKINGIHGVHITALFWEDIIPRLIKEVNLYPRP